MQGQIDEAGTGDVDLGDQGIVAQPRGNLFGEIARLGLCLLGQHHGGIGRHVAVAGIARRLDHHAREIDALGPVAGLGEIRADRVHAPQHIGKQV